MRKKESKTLEKVRNYSKRSATYVLFKYSSRVLSRIRAVRARAVEEMFTRKLTNNYAYLEILVPLYLNNPAEEAIFGSNRIKKQYDTMKLPNKEVMLKNA